MISVLDGKRLGLIGDLEIDLLGGRVKGIVIPGGGKVFGLFGRDNDIYIPWEKVVKIGVDVVLVDLPVEDMAYIEDEA
ncbi:MAG: hypothetical protein DDT39_00910 [Firmicutes bacterium]|nr:hypothetical protein [candidate division NPL-UPA2 bacterium]